MEFNLLIEKEICLCSIRKKKFAEFVGTKLLKSGP